MSKLKLVREPRKWKTVIIVLVGIYPIVTFLQVVFSHELSLIHSMALRTLVVTAAAVPIMVYAMEPLLHGVFSRWLSR